MIKRLCLGICAVAILNSYATPRDVPPVQPVMSQFAPVVLQASYYVPYNLKAGGMVDLLARLERDFSHPHMQAKVIYHRTQQANAKQVEKALIQLGMKKQAISLEMQVRPLYPMYVVMQSFGKKQEICHFKQINSFNLFDVPFSERRPCYLINNQHLQAEF